MVVVPVVEFVITSAALPDLDAGEKLYLQNYAACHGNLGEGGANPAKAGDIIAPISTAEYLGTRDDTTLRAIIAQGQPNFGMSPFADSFGGPLDSDQIDLLVAYVRAWQDNPPVDLPPDVPVTPGGGEDAAAVYVGLCAQCHGPSGEGGIGPAFDAAWQSAMPDSEIFNAINLGHPATAMVAWGEVLGSQQIEDLVTYIRTLTGVATASGPVTYVSTVKSIFGAYCTACHGSSGGWSAATYQEVMTTGDDGAMIIPGDPDNSPLVQTLIGTHPDGMVMPPSVKMRPADIQKIVEWVKVGAPEK